MELSSKRKKVKSGTPRPGFLLGRKKAPKPEPPAPVEPSTVDDEEVRATGVAVEEPVEEEKPSVLIIPAFYGGFVHMEFEDAVVAPTRRSTESELFQAAIQHDIRFRDMFVGSIAVKNSFMRKEEGGVIL